MKAPIHRLKKADIQKLSKGQCRHAHSYLDHYNCYVTENPDEIKRIGFLDIESSNLDADFGHMLSWCIKPSDSKKILSGLISKTDIFNSEPGHADKRIVKELIDTLPKFDKAVTWYGARFDLPFIRARAIINNIEFPTYGSLVHKDLWFTCRGKFKLSSNRLENACKVLLGDTQKTRIEPKYWHGAMRGDAKSLKYILDHNRFDVLDLERLYNKIESFGRPSNTSI